MKKPKKVTKAVIQKRYKKAQKRILKQTLEAWRQKVIARDLGTCQVCLKVLSNQPKNVHHIISLQSVKRKYPILLSDVQNGILLCSFCHKFAPNSPHQSGFEFTMFLMKHKPEQYFYLLEFLKYNQKP
jgi:5-methylcytosine-specific restriction endonuclease McrA